MSTSNEIPNNADKILFAEDLVNYVLPHQFVVFNLPRTANRYRNFVYNGFNETMEAAVDGIINEMPFKEDFTYHDGIELYGPSSDSSAFMTYVEQYRQVYFSCEFNINHVLPYCVYLAVLAADFWKKGHIEAPSLAVRCIVETFEDFNVTNDGWDSLNESAELYSLLNTDVDRDFE